MQQHQGAQKFSLPKPGAEVHATLYCSHADSTAFITTPLQSHISLNTDVFTECSVYAWRHAPSSGKIKINYMIECLSSGVIRPTQITTVSVKYDKY